MMSQHSHSPSLVVGVGASAGGLAVLKKFVSYLPEKSGMAIVIVQHLDPSHESMLSELLGRTSTLPVRTAEHDQILQPDEVVVMPSNTGLELQGAKLKLVEPGSRTERRQTIDHFFRSLAREWGERCAGIILSGSGSDGTAGLRAIKAAGGLALAQDPDTAEHRSMPDSAVRAHVLDRYLEIEKMPDVLKQYIDHPMTTRKQGNESESGGKKTYRTLEEIGAILKTFEEFDLTQYKPTTVQRRIGRRMSLTNTEKPADYLSLLRKSERERKLLAKDLLINVTDFFRDPEAFHFLEQTVIPNILTSLGRDEDLRVWIPGCASGEEVYSIAILLMEALSQAHRQNELRIFATDIDDRAIHTARKGIYPESIAREVPKRYLEKYFTKYENDHYYKVRGFLRDKISFATQNVAKDPPFNHMHLISCRNLLIYLTRPVQETILSSFYFALEGPSFLFLGSSENLGSRSKFFKTVSKKWRIYQKIPGQRDQRDLLKSLHVERVSTEEESSSADGPPKVRRSDLSHVDRMKLALLETAVPPAAIVDTDGRILYLHGNLAPYLSFPEGEPRNEIIELVHPAMRSRLRSGLFKVRKYGKAKSFSCLVEFNEKGGEPYCEQVTMDIVPMEKQNFVDGLAISVLFRRQEPVTEEEKQITEKVDEATGDLEQELAETREELQSTIEELETNTEELKAAHEEALSTNEELQSSNEELEASSEELRSLNEELSIVNSQLKEKMEELKRASDDVENFFASTNLPTIFLDPELNIKRYTPAAELLLKMGPRDIDRYISSLGRDLIDSRLEDECRSVLQDFQPIRTEKKDYQGRWFIRQVSPYRTEDRRIEGVVIVFQDVTELKELHRRAESREKQQSVVARLGMLALGGSEPEELMRQAVRQVAKTLNADYCKVLKYLPEEKAFRMIAGIGWQEGLVGEAMVPASQNSQAGYTLMAKQPVIVEDLEEESRFNGPELLTDHQVTSGISCLINHTDPPFGVLGVHCREKRIFTQEDANFLQSVANMLSTALHTKEAQERIFESEEKFRTMVNSIPQLAWMTDETGDIFWYNEQWYAFTGTRLEEMQGWGWQKIQHPDHVERVVAKFRKHLESGEEWEDTFPLRSKEGDYRWFLSRAKPIHDREGKIVRWFGTNTDITDKLEQEEALRQSEYRLRLAKDSGRLGLYDYDMENNVIVWDPLLREIWGLDPDEEVTLAKFYAGVHEDDLETAKEAIEKATDPEGSGRYSLTYRVIHQKTAVQHWIKASGLTQFKNQVPVRMTGLVEDISAQENTRQELEASEERLRFILQTSMIGVWELDLKTGEANRSIEHDRIFGYEELLPTWSYEQFLDHVHEEDRERVDQLFKESLVRGVWNFECRITRVHTRDERWIWATGRVQMDDDGQPRRMLGMAIDITERKLLENSMREAVQNLQETDAKKNEFLSILGHELRNPLATLSGGVDILKDSIGEDHEILRLMDHSMLTMSKLLDDLLDLRRVSQNKIQIEVTPVDVGRILGTVQKSISESLKENKQRLECEIQEGLLVLGDEIRLEQVFLNLLQNSTKYTQKGGRIQLTAERKGSEIHIEVRDDGIGMEPEEMEKIFMPFYQVRIGGQVSSGLGIGLALCKKLVELHGGSISAASPGLGKGSTFSVSLPATSEKEVRQQNSSKKKASLVRRGTRVLLIEDNESILITMPMQLTKMGCQVETARTGARGLELARTYEPDVVLVDIGLPDMTGHEVGRRLRSAGFNRLLVAISGYSHKEVREKSKEAGFDQHIAKPASPHRLMELFSSLN